MRSFVEVQSAFSIIGTETGVRNVVVENSEEFPTSKENEAKKPRHEPEMENDL